MTNIDKLTALQNSLGYVEGDINPVALLGLLGESGEVGAEVYFINNRRDDWSEEGRMICKFETKMDNRLAKHYEASRKIENYKKRIRSTPKLAESFIIKVGGRTFDMELADVAYYLNALAINRGKTLDELCGMAAAKVEAKIAKTNDRHL